ncbi:Sodium bile acid symporter family protein, partial [Trichostrongylus colubriformis]
EINLILLADSFENRYFFRTLTIRVIDYDPVPEENRNVVMECANNEICEVLSYPNSVSFTPENNNTVTFKVVIKSLFLGITQLNITIGDEVLPPFPLRLLRSSREAKVTLAFNISIGIFVFVISTMMGTQLELKRIVGIARKPVGPIIGFCCQFMLMPTIGYLLAEYGLPKDATSLKMALFATATCPGGGKSSFWTIIFGGNLDLSISMTFTQTVAALCELNFSRFSLSRFFVKDLRA